MAAGLAVHSPVPMLLTAEDLASFENRYTERCPDYAQVAENCLQRPQIRPWPPRTNWRYNYNQRGGGGNHGRRDRGDARPQFHDNRNRHRGRDRDGDRDRGDNRSSGGYNSNNGNNHRRYGGGYRREPYRDLDDVREQKSKYEKEKDEADDVAKYLDNYRRTVMEKGKSDGKTDSSVKTDAEAPKPARTSSATLLPSKSGSYDLLSNVLGHPAAGSGDCDAGVHVSPFDKYRVQPKGAAMPTHQPLPYELAQRNADPASAKKKPGQRGPAPQASSGAAGAEKQRKAIAASAARSQKAILDAVKAAGGKSKAGAATASLVKCMASSSPKKSPSKASHSPKKSPPKARAQAAMTHSPLKIKLSKGDGSRRGSLSSAASSSPDHDSGDDHALARAASDGDTCNQLKSEVLLEESKIVLRLATSAPSTPPETEPVQLPVAVPAEGNALKVRLRLGPPPPAVCGDDGGDKVKKHKKHKKHKRHHDSMEAHEPTMKKVKLYQ